MKRTTRIVFCIVVILYNGCRSFDPYLLRPVEQNRHLLPPLEVLMDHKSFELAYGIPQTEYKKTEYINPSPTGTIREISIQKESLIDKRVQQSMTILQREINYNICETGQPQGYCVCRIMNREISGNSSWFVLSMLTGFSINLLGFPIGSVTTVLDVELDIQDINHKLIARYTGIGKDDEYGAVYWGYNFYFDQFQKDYDNDISRVANARALLQCMNSIKKQIDRDTDYLRDKMLMANIVQDSLQNLK